jgi:cation transport ATPase
VSPEKTRAKHSAEKNMKLQGSFEVALPIRLGIAAVLVIISALFKMPVLVRYILLILSIVVAGYDIFLASVDDIAAKKYFSTSIVILFAAVLGFVIGFPTEAAVMVILYQLSGILIDYTRKRALQSRQELKRSPQPRMPERPTCSLRWRRAQPLSFAVSPYSPCFMRC